MNISKIEPDKMYARGTATNLLGINSNAFVRLFRDNSLFRAYASQPVPVRDGKRSTYSGKDIIEQVERLEDSYLGCRLYCDYVELSEDEFSRKYHGRSRDFCFNKETYLEQAGGWFSSQE